MQDSTPLWQPNEALIDSANISHFTGWLNKRGLTFNNYEQLHQWSVQNIETFWEHCLQYFNIQFSGLYTSVLQGKMPGATWFNGISLSYAEHIFKNSTSLYPAIIYSSEEQSTTQLTWQDLHNHVSGLQQFFISNGIKQGDRVAAYLPNCPEASISFLATNSIGAIWSSCSPDFGKQAVLDRFVQIEPKILIATTEYTYGGKHFDKSEILTEIINSLPSLEQIILLDSQGASAIQFKYTRWSAIKPSTKPIQFTRVPFHHPIWVLYSSGTTGMPKAITHGTGGVLLEQLKYLTFHQDLKKGERLFWYSTTGWMMWNYIQGALLVGGTMVLYDGHPAFPDRSKLWNLVDECSINHFGISGSYIVSMMKSELTPKDEFKLNSLRSIGSTGSPLPVEGFHWIYNTVQKDVWLTSMSGGTDICSAFVGGCPTLPVYAGEIQCIALGCDLQVWNEDGHAVQGEEGELIVTQPMPSMPVSFWNDPDFKKYSESYFEMFPGVWRHGDWISKTSHNGLIIYGRSDATLNRGGVRIGSAEIYKTLNKIPEIIDGLIVCIDKAGGEFYMPLFVTMKDKVLLDDALKKKINHLLKTECSPRHVPDEIVVCTDIPYTLSGKKTETPVKKILMGKDPNKVVNMGSLRNPASINFFVKFFQSHLA